MADHLCRTRKPQVCRVCGEMIKAGAQVWRRTGFDSDGPWTVHLHPECEQLTLKWELEDWEIYGPGDHKRPVQPDLRERLEECLEREWETIHVNQHKSVQRSRLVSAVVVELARLANVPRADGDRWSETEAKLLEKLKA